MLRPTPLRRPALAPPWVVGFLVLAAIWGSSFLLIKISLRGLAPPEVSFGRVAFGTAALLVALRVTRDALPRGRRIWLHLSVVALLTNSVPFTLIAYGEEHVSSILAGLWNATTPLWAFAVATLMLATEQPTRRRALGLLGGLAGVVVVLGPWHGLSGNHFSGQLMCLAAAACFGLAFPYTRRFLTGTDASAIALSTGQLLCSSAQLAIFVLIVAPPAPELSAEVLSAIAALGIVGTGIAYILYYAVIRAAGSTTASTVTYVIPVVSTTLGVVLLSEPLSWNQPVGAVLVLASVAWSERTPRVQAGHV